MWKESFSNQNFFVCAVPATLEWKWRKLLLFCRQQQPTTLQTYNSLLTTRKKYETWFSIFVSREILNFFRGREEQQQQKTRRLPAIAVFSSRIESSTLYILCCIVRAYNHVFLGTNCGLLEAACSHLPRQNRKQLPFGTQAAFWSCSRRDLLVHYFSTPRSAVEVQNSRSELSERLQRKEI